MSHSEYEQSFLRSIDPDGLAIDTLRRERDEARAQVAKAIDALRLCHDALRSCGEIGCGAWRDSHAQALAAAQMALKP